MHTPTTHPDQIPDSTFWRKVGRIARHVPFTTELVAAYYAMRDPNTPLRHKLILGGAIAYFLLPLDAVPDFIPGLGYGDDAAALMAALGAVRLSVHDEHRARARHTLGLAVEGDVVDGSVVTD